jgi:hypothetical protein
VGSAVIDQAFLNTFINAAFGLPIAHENITYKPVPGTAYVELLVLENDVTPWSLNSTNETDGVFRMILRYPADSGGMAAKLKADEMFAVFKIGAEVCYNGSCATITGHSRRPGVAEDGWYKIVADARYRAFLARG